ncbi:MAG: hypothetical protein NTW86_29090, partial [Candidatus Sumerlaeota bacterium]|nr:hypothetical protein [Candidatus Sumerlaeota bacterium]
MRSRSGVANKRGSVFLLALFISGMLAVSAVLLVSMGQNSFRAQAKRTVRKEAFYLAESALQHALFHIGEDSSFSSQSTLAAPVEWTATPGNDNSQLPNLSLTGDQELKVRIENAPSGLGGHYQVTAQAQVFNVAQSIRVVAQKDPPSKVFDYAYFLNNWGWW